MKLRPQSFFRLFTDGASRGNPGPSGAGAALYSPTKAPYARLSSYLGHHLTNNAAEYHAVLCGILLARSLEVSRLLVFSDSQLLVRQIAGRYSVLNPALKILNQQVTDMTQLFEACRFVHVRRHQNEVADGLANLAIDEGVPLRIFLSQGECADDVRRRFEEFRSAHIDKFKKAARRVAS